MVVRIFVSSFQNIKRIKILSFVEEVMSVLITKCQLAKTEDAVDWNRKSSRLESNIFKPHFSEHTLVEWNTSVVN